MITYNKIRELEREEKNTKKLQKLPETFIEDLNIYMRKKSLVNSNDINQIKDTLERLIELRTEKIVKLASDTIKITESNILTENFTKIEKDVYNKIIKLLNIYRQNFLIESNKEILYKIKKSLPEFVGTDMKIYKLEKNKLISLPQALSELLLKKDIIEKMNYDKN